jgi:hypothetical protein
MKQLDYKFAIGVIVFIIGLLLAILLQINQKYQFLGWASLGISLIYLLFGWFFFRGYFPTGHLWVLILFGYLYSGIFISLFFLSKELPLANTMIKLTPVWAGVQAILVFYLRKKMPKNGARQFFIEVMFLIIISILMVIRF